MIEFLFALFFAKAVLLTPQPVDINSRLELTPGEPLTVVSTGAHLEIDVTSMVPAEQRKDLFRHWSEIEAGFPSGAIEAEMFDSRGGVSRFVYEGYSSISERNIFLSLSSVGELSKKSEFTKVVVKSRVPLKAVSVYWRNYKK